VEEALDTIAALAADAAVHSRTLAELRAILDELGD